MKAPKNQFRTIMNRFQEVQNAAFDSIELAKHVGTVNVLEIA